MEAIDALVLIGLQVVEEVDIMVVDMDLMVVLLDGGGSGYVNTLKLSGASTKAGNISFPNTAGTGNETGHSGNGAAKITLVN